MAVTLGDPRGIGPEVAEAALADREVAGAASFVRVGPASLLRSPDDVSAGGWAAADGVATGWPAVAPAEPARRPELSRGLAGFAEAARSANSRGCPLMTNCMC